MQSIYITIFKTLPLFCLLISSSAFSNNNANLVPLEVYSEAPNKSLVRISPNGKLLAYRLTEKERDLLVIVDLSTKKVIRGFDVSQINPENAYFISNERLIFKVETRGKIRGFIGRHDISNAFLFDIEKNEMNQLLIAGKGIYKGQTQLGNIVGLSSDGRFAFMTAYTQRSKYAVAKNSLVKVNLNKPYKTPMVHVEGDTGVIDYFIDKNSQLLAREVYNQESNLHTIEVPVKGGWKVIFSKETPYITHSFAGITQDEKHLVMNVNQANSNEDFFLLSLESGQVSSAGFEQKGTDIEHVLSDINRVVYGIKYTGFKPSYTFFEQTLTKQFERIQQELPASNISLTDFTPDHEKLIVFTEWDGLAGDFLSFNNGKSAHLASLWKSLQWKDLHNVIEFKYKARDGLVIPTLLTIPEIADGDKSKLPAIVLPHGGPESYDKKTFHWLAQYFANRGYLVIQPQFRGSSGFGAEHTLKGRGEWGKKMQDDLADAVKTLVKLGEIDKDRVCIVGTSYGGYAALAGVAFTPNIYQCAISINGVSDIEEMLDEEEGSYGRDSSVLAYWKENIVNNDVNSEVLKNVSPAKQVGKIESPILLIHGTDDQVVPIKQSEIMFEALEDARKEVSFIKLKMEGHHLMKYKSRLKVLKSIDEFINKHIG